MDVSPFEKELINGWQKGFPLVPQPYAQIASELNVEEEQVISALASLRQRGILSRVGAVVTPNSVGASSLVAMSVPKSELEQVAEIVCAEPSVNHNYERENDLNLWFVVTATDGDDLDRILARIEDNTGYKTIKLQLEKAFHIDLGFSI